MPKRTFRALYTPESNSEPSRKRLGNISVTLQQSNKLCDVCAALRINAADFLEETDDAKSQTSGTGSVVTETTDGGGLSEESSEDNDGYYGYPTEEDQEGSELRKYKLGLLGDLAAKVNCPLCRLFSRAIIGTVGDPDEEKMNAMCELRWSDDGHSVSGGPHRSALTVTAYPWMEGFRMFNRIVSLADDAPSDEQSLFGRRYAKNQMDLRISRKWVSCCEEWHQNCGDALLNASHHKLQIDHVLVINTMDMCLEDIEFPSRYAALSYVWGSKKVFRTIKTNVSQLREKDAFARVWHDVPLTIRDTITVCQQSNERYVWVDSLCIVQDDEEDKGRMIGIMDAIYSNAYLTIVAATGDNANHGLPGIRPNSRGSEQATAEHRPGMHLIAINHLDDIMKESTYDERAWTFQERLMSRRCLIFGDGEAIFKCQKSIWREDVNAETPAEVINYDSAIGRNPSQTPTGGEDPGDDNPYSDYRGHLFNYTRRKLSYSSDIINAFTEVLNTVCRRMQATAFYGVPDVIFDAVLLWDTRASTPSERRDGFPTWSWTGWIGGISVRNPSITTQSFVNIKTWIRTKTWIRWYVYDTKLNKTAPMKHIMKVSSDDIGIHHHLYIASIPPPPWVYSMQSPLPYEPTRIAHNPPTGLIQFWTITAHFHISARDRRIPVTHLVNVLDPNGVISGEIWSQRIWNGADGIHKSLSLSEAADTDISDDFQDDTYAANILRRAEEVDLDLDAYDLGDPSPNHTTGPQDFDVPYDRNAPGDNEQQGTSELVSQSQDPPDARENAELAGDTWNSYNVMSVEERDGIAYRAGVGTSYQRASRHAFEPGPRWTEVALG